MLEKISRFGAKIGGQRHMIALRDSFASTMPLVLAGSFATLLNNVFFVPWSLVGDWTAAEDGTPSAFIEWATEYIKPYMDSIYNGSLAILSLVLVFSIAYNLAKSYEEDGLSAGIVAVGAFFVLGPLSRITPVAGWVTNYFGAQGIFVALFVGLVATEIFVRINKKGLVIKMPEMVPPAVGRAFAAVIPGGISLMVIALIAYLFQMVPALAPDSVTINEEMVEAPKTLFAWVEQNVSEVLSDLLSGGDGASMFIGAGFASFISLFVGLFWSVGLHGANLLSPVMDSLYGMWGQENVALYAAGEEAAHVWVRVSWDIYVFFGGSGATLALLGAIFFAGKKKEEKEIAKLGVGPGAFQINEPVIFGLPIVLNPIYAIPFIISQPILTFTAYIATAIGLVNPPISIIPWTTPPFLSAYLATLDWRAVILALFNFVLAFLIYLPFVRASNNKVESTEE